MREKLIVIAAEILTTDGPKALTTRRIAAEAGTSTMVVYTYFGSMDQLRRELRHDGFMYLCKAIDKLPSTDDSVADLAAALGTYADLGVENLTWYRALFADLPPEQDAQAGAGVHERLVALVDRCVVSGRFTRPEPRMTTIWAAELWLVVHGVVNLNQSPLLTVESARFWLADMLYRLMVGFGDRPDRASESINQALHIHVGSD